MILNKSDDVVDILEIRSITKDRRTSSGNLHYLK